MLLCPCRVATQVAECILNIKPGRLYTRSSLRASNVRSRTSVINNSRLVPPKRIGIAIKGFFSNTSGSRERLGKTACNCLKPV
jgi:hypothetical protein